MTTDATRHPRKRRWTRILALQVAVILAVPVVFGVVLGWFDINPPAAESISSVGSEAHDLLNGFPDDTLVVEIDYQASAGPPPAAAVGVLESRINETCSKSSVTVNEYAFGSGTTQFSEGGLFGLEQSLRHSWSSPGTLVVDYLYLDGADADNPNTIGLAYRGASIAVFEGTIQADAPAGEAAAVTTTVMVHEFGHELGLVGLVGSAPNEDPNHPGHSSDPNDVMYWSVDSTALLGGLLGGGGPPTQFDAADLADLATVKATPIVQEVLPWLVLVASLVGAGAVFWQATRRRPWERLAKAPSHPATPGSPVAEKDSGEGPPNVGQTSK
jgi:hypothetical protein